MGATSKNLWTGLGAAVVSVSMLASVGAQAGTSAGTVRVPQSVVADGQPLPAGSYDLQLSDAAVDPVVGQPEGSQQWVQFVQNGTVRGRELAARVEAADIAAIAKTTPPSPGTARVELLRSGEYLRIWLNRAGTHYLVHLATAAR